MTWVLAGLAFVLGFLRPLTLPREEPARLLRGPDPWVNGDFQPGRTYPTISADNKPPVVAAGSWIDSDTWQGSAATRWFVPSRVVRVYVCGYPRRADCSLYAEFRTPSGEVVRRDFDLQNPHETWRAWDIRVPVGTDAMRIVAADGSSQPAGWLAFSEPVVRPPELGASIYLALQIGSSFALALTLLFVPGLIVGGSFRSREIRTALLLGTGPALLGLIALLTWAGIIGPAAAGATILVIALWVSLGVALWRCEKQVRTWSPHTCLMFGVAALIGGATVAKASYGGGPRGELYHGSIHRTLAVGDRSDARIPFSVVQLVAHQRSPLGPEANVYFRPWSFFSRGPVAGLVAAPLVLATGGRPPVDLELRNWTPFDAHGYAAYRITLIALSSAVILAFYRVLSATLTARWALAGAMLFAVTPFTVHEVMFTWPKWQATTWLMVGFLFAHRFRPGFAGMSLGVGYLFHPLALLWLPWLGLWVLYRTRSAWFRAGVRFAASAALVIVSWAAAGQMLPPPPDAAAAGQSGFVSYLWRADSQPATLATWRDARLRNFANTFVPFWLHAVNRDHAVLNGTHAPSDAWVKFAFGWWNTLPLGAGLLLWSLGTTAIVIGMRKLARPLLTWLIGPAILLTIYWGAATTGLMRECGHPLLPAFIGLACAAVASTGSSLPRKLIRALFHPIAITWRCVEVLLLLWSTTALNNDAPGGEFTALNGVYLGLSFIAIMLVGIISAFVRRAGKV